MVFILIALAGMAGVFFAGASYIHKRNDSRGIIPHMNGLQRNLDSGGERFHYYLEASQRVGQMLINVGTGIESTSEGFDLKTVGVIVHDVALYGPEVALLGYRATLHEFGDKYGIEPLGGTFTLSCVIRLAEEILNKAVTK